MGGKKQIDTRFEKFGTISFTSTTRVNDFVDYLEQDKVAGTRCRSCGEHYFPPRADCCSCFTSEMDWFFLEGLGKLAAFSTLQYGPRGFEEDLPYTVGVLEYEKYRVFGRVASEINPRELQVGLPMVARVKHLETGQLSYEFTVRVPGK